MPNHKSCEKRMRRSEKERQHNRSFRTSLRAAIKELRTQTSRAQAEPLLRAAGSLLDKAAAVNLVHPRNAARQKSRLAVFVSKLG